MAQRRTAVQSVNLNCVTDTCHGSRRRVVAPEAVPTGRVLGPQVGENLRRLQERKGVAFHLQQRVAAIEEREIVLKGRPGDGGPLERGLAVLPHTALVFRSYWGKPVFTLRAPVFHRRCFP